MNPIASRIQWILKGKGGVAAILQTLLSRVLILSINVATGIITARALNPAGRGEQAAIILWSVFLASTVTLGLPSSVIYNFKRYSAQKSELFSAALLVGTILGFVACIIGILFIPLWLSNYSSEVIHLAQWFMLNSPIVLLFAVGSAALEAQGDFTTSNQIRCFLPLITLIALAGLAVTGTLTPLTAGLAYVLNGIPIFVWMMFRLWRSLHPRWQGIGLACKRLIHYGIRAYGIDLLAALASQADQILVVGLLSPAAMGMYIVALSLARILNVFQTSIVTVLFPKIAARPMEEVIAVTGQAARISTTLALSASVLVMILGPLLLQLLYGAEYLGAVDVLRLLVVEVVLSGTTVVLAQAFMALEKPGIVTFLQGVGLAASLPLLITLIPLYGLAGAGLALVGTTLIRLIFILICYPLVLKTRPPDLLIKREDFVFLAKTLHLER